MDNVFTITAAIISAVGTILSVWLGRRYIKKNRVDPVVEDIAQSANVYTALRYTMEEMHADRAYVLEFHNGGHYYSGRGQQKFSCTHEITAEGVSRECNNSQEHRVSQYHTYISELIENEYFANTDISTMDDHAFSNMLQHAGVKSIYNVPIKTLNGKIIGILGLDYVKTHASKNTIGVNSLVGNFQFNEESCKFMKRQARIVAGYLL